MSAAVDDQSMQRHRLPKPGPLSARRRWRHSSILLVVLAAAAVLVGPAGSAQTEAGKLVFATNGDGVSNLLEIGVVSPNGGPIKKLTHHRVSGDRPTWTTTGRQLLFQVGDSFTGRESYWRIGVDGRGTKRLPGADGWSTPSPDGRHVAQIGGSADIEILNQRGRVVRRLSLGRSVNWDREYLGGPPLWSPDGRWLAVDFGSDVADYGRTVVIRADGRGRARGLGKRIDGRYETANAWSRRGRYLALSTQRGLELVRPDGTGRRRIAGKDAAWNYVSWAPNERQLVYAGRNGGIYIAGKGRPRRIIRTVSTRWQARRDLSVAWSPTGRRIAYTDRNGLFVVRPDGSRRRRVARGRVSIPSWDPHGHRLVYGSGGAVFVVAISGRDRRPRAVLPESTWDDSPEWSPDGTRIAFLRGPEGLDSAHGVSIYAMRADGTHQTRIGRGYGPRWSSDGRHLAFVDPVSGLPPGTGKQATSRILVADVVRRDAKVVARGTAPTWSPDGRRLAFMQYEFEKETSGPARGSYFVSHSSLFSTAADGNDTELIASSEEAEFGKIHYYDPAWSPDGSAIAVVGIGEETHDVTLVDIATRSRRTLPIEAKDIAWSPDGTRLAYSTMSEIGVIRRDGTDKRVLAGGSSGRLHPYFSDPRWSSDGGRVAFINSDGGDEVTRRPASQDVYLVNVDGTGLMRVTRTPGVEGSLDWSAR